MRISDWSSDVCSSDLEFLLHMKPDSCLKYVLALDESSGGDGILVRDDVKTIADLKGKQVAFNEGSVSQFWLNVILKENGMSQDDIEMVNMTSDDAAAAFMENQIGRASCRERVWQYV